MKMNAINTQTPILWPIEHVFTHPDPAKAPVSLRFSDVHQRKVQLRQNNGNIYER